MGSSPRMIDDIVRRVTEQHDLGFERDSHPYVQIQKRFEGQESEFLILSLKLAQRSLCLYVKIAKANTFPRETVDSRLVAEYNCLNAAHKRFSHYPRFATPRPIAFLPEWRAIVTTQVPGEPLKHLIVSQTQLWAVKQPYNLQEAMFLCGQWLCEFHRHVSAVTGFEMGDLGSYVSHRVKILESAGLADTNLGAVLSKRIREREREVCDSLNSVVTHSDFIPANVLFDGQGISVLDFSWAAEGSRYFDIVAFWLDLERLGEMPNYSRKRMRLLQKAFLTGYGGISEECEAFQLFELVHRVNSAVVLWRLSQRCGVLMRTWHWFEMKKQLRWLQRCTR